MGKKKVDYYRTAKCPKCGRFMVRIGPNDWECRNPKHAKR
jgi:tRNA(Ile2) C34 agmatinyltransferase TiaS